MAGPRHSPPVHASAAHGGPLKGARKAGGALASLLDRLTVVSGGELGGWCWDVDGAAPGPADAKEFAAALEAANPQDDAELIGWTGFVLGRQPDGGYARLRISAGGTDEYTPFTATLNLFSGPGVQAPPLDGRLDVVLAVLVDVWDADCGLVYNRELFEAVKSAYGLSAADPRVGWAVHVSANRAARVPERAVFRARHGDVAVAVLIRPEAEAIGSLPAEGLVPVDGRHSVSS
ncbi:hypothetical protein [Streptomyces sp. NPDC005407]|uniref:hypothetical protein n=1 Tax=Streptomyces sp. NPDC005407 TaxID=3155340 RepID=UPI0033BB03B8